MLIVLALAEATIFGVAATISTLIGVGLAIAAHRGQREAATEKAAAETHEQLLAARAEAEQLSAELHKLKLERGEKP